jgi:hypothetical protein
LYQQAIANNSHTEVVLFESWSRGATHPLITGTSTNTSFESTAQFQNELRTNYRLLRDNLNNEYPDNPLVTMAPVGDAWESAGALLPPDDPDFVDLFMENEAPYWGYHANDRGTYLAACVFYAKLYGQSPVGLHADPLIQELNLNFGPDPNMPSSSKPWLGTRWPTTSIRSPSSPIPPRRASPRATQWSSKPKSAANRPSPPNGSRTASRFPAPPG